VARTNNRLTAVPDVSNFINWRQANRFTFGNPLRNVMQVSGNVMAGMRWGEPLMNSIRTALPNSNLVLSGTIRTLDVTDNVIENEDNYFLADEVNLHGNQFTFPLGAADAVAAWVLAGTAMYTENRARVGGFNIINGVTVPQNLSVTANNFRLAVVNFAPT
jgi:hypothetical protein